MFTGNRSYSRTLRAVVVALELRSLLFQFVFYLIPLVVPLSTPSVIIIMALRVETKCLLGSICLHRIEVVKKSPPPEATSTPPTDQETSLIVIENAKYIPTNRREKMFFRGSMTSGPPVIRYNKPLDVVCKILFGKDNDRLVNEAKTYETSLRPFRGNHVPQYYGLFEGKAPDGKVLYCIVLEDVGDPIQSYFRDISWDFK